MNLKIFSYLASVLILDFTFTQSEKLDFKNIAFTVLSQENSRHEERAVKLKNEIHKDTNFSSSVYLTHIDFNHIGDWTVLPILPVLWMKLKQKFSWVFFCTDETKVYSLRLKEVLENLPDEVTFVGRSLTDKEPTIIHHFASIKNFQYPLFASGFAMHYNLIKQLIEKIQKSDIIKKVDFSIDASHELSLIIKKTTNGTTLTHSEFFCIDYKKNCATSVKNNYICDKPIVDVKKIDFAVKTCEKFYNDRIPVVQKTWAQWAYHLTFYSDTFDEKIPTVRLETLNSKSGHCFKTQLIIRYIDENMKLNSNLDWAVIADDDTIFSTYRLQELLGCYNPEDSIVIGERYGFNVFSSRGYNYITGGGGIVISKAAIKKISEGDCQCPSPETPDDMFLFGHCLDQLDITLVHSSLFHQARPVDYSEEYLMIGPPISFHKHWMIDPVKVYENWFQLSDVLSGQKVKHIEL